jgi:hypothetical protein
MPVRCWTRLRLGVMVALTPSVAVLAFLVWREGIGLPRDLKFNDQPFYSNSQQPDPAAHRNEGEK